MPATQRLTIGSICCLILGTVTAQPIWALGQEAFGPAGKHISRSSDWPRGTEDVLRHPSRVYWNWVNGNEHAYYEGGINTINELLDLFGKMDLNVHQAVLRHGSPEARSFRGLLVSYQVEFELPNGIFLSHARELAASGLYCATPRLIINVNDRLAKQLDDLTVPANVRLLAQAHRVEDALAQAKPGDRSLRYRAITVLGEAGDSSPAVMEALKLASTDENESISNAARDALEKIEKAVAPDARPFREHVASFLLRHPQHYRTPNPGNLLVSLQSIDAQYAEGFTATGTMIRPMLSGWDRLIAWTLTMGDGRLVIQQRAVVDDLHPRAEGQLDHTLYAGPDKMGTIHRSRLWVDGKLIDSKPHNTFEPVGSTYDLLIGRLLWPLGRGYCRRIDQITKVTAQADGTLAVLAVSDAGNLDLRWELRIDPNAGYLVRSAKAYRRDATEPSYIIDGMGVMRSAGRSTSHTARWSEGQNAQPVSISVTSVTDKADMELIRQTEKELVNKSD